MKKLTLLAGALLLLLTSAFVLNQVTDWKVKEGYSVKVFRNAQLQFPIYFKGLKAAISFDKQHPEKAKIQATIDATTVDTGNESMTAHAKEENVLHTDKFPEITFESRSVRATTTGYETTGDLTLKGITKEITFPFTFENDTFIGEFSIAASDFNINREGAVPSGEIRIELTIPVTKSSTGSD
jgi:polyisoprenoid-binding protein YceI